MGWPERYCGSGPRDYAQFVIRALRNAMKVIGLIRYRAGRDEWLSSLFYAISSAAVKTACLI